MVGHTGLADSAPSLFAEDSKDLRAPDAELDSNLAQSTRCQRIAFPFIQEATSVISNGHLVPSASVHPNDYASFLSLGSQSAYARLKARWFRHTGSNSGSHNRDALHNTRIANP